MSLMSAIDEAAEKVKKQAELEAKGHKFLDPNEFALTIQNKTKNQIIDALDYRIKTLTEYNVVRMADTIDELNTLRRFVKGILYQKDSYKDK